MADLINEGSGERTHVQSLLMRESLMDQEVLAASDAQQVIPILPDVHVNHIGGAAAAPQTADAPTDGLGFGPGPLVDVRGGLPDAESLGNVAEFGSLSSARGCS